MSDTFQASEAEIKTYNAFVLKHQWRNFWINVIDGVLYTMGLALVPADTVLPGFISDCVERVGHLRPFENRLAGVLALIMAACFMMPQQLWAARLCEGRAILKKLLIFVAFLERLPWFFMGMMAALVARQRPEIALYLFFAIIFSYQFILGIVSPVWQEFVAKVTPVNRRGLLFGVREGVGGALGAAMLIVANRYVGRMAFSANYAALFFGMFGLILISWVPLLWVKEAPYPVRRERKPLLAHFASLVEVFKVDRSFRRYFFCRAVFGLSYIAAAPLFAMRAMRVVGAEAKVALMVEMAIVIMLSRTVIGVVLGPLGDRFGYRLIMAFAGLSGACGIVAALLAAGSWGFYAAYALSTCSFMAFWLGHSNYILELAPPGKRPSYIGLDNVIGLPFVAAPFVGGHLADKFGYAIPFAIGAVLALASAVMFRLLCAEPRAAMNRDIVS